jgi:hypothetical protein
METTDEKLIKKIRARIKELKKSKAKKKKPVKKKVIKKKKKPDLEQKQTQKQEVNILFGEGVEIRKKRKRTTRSKPVQRVQPVPQVQQFQPMFTNQLNEIYALQNTFNDFQNRIALLDKKIQTGFTTGNETLNSLQDKREKLMERLKQSRMQNIQPPSIPQQPPTPSRPVFEPLTPPPLIEEKVEEIPQVFEPEQKFVPIIEKEELPELTFEPELLQSNIQPKFEELPELTFEPDIAQLSKIPIVKGRVTEIEAGLQTGKIKVKKPVKPDLPPATPISEGEGEGIPIAQFPTGQEPMGLSGAAAEDEPVLITAIPPLGNFNDKYNMLTQNNKERFKSRHPSFFTIQGRNKGKIRADSTINSGSSGIIAGGRRNADNFLNELITKQLSK